MNLFGQNAYKFGLFGANCAGGMVLSAAPERWMAQWDDIIAVYQLADTAGIEFILPIAKWRGLGGKADLWGSSYETFTHGAAAGALTRSIGIFVTAHVLIVTPAFVAKAISTIDHVTHGRVGLNVVCGWNRDEFDQHGVTIEGEVRYDQGLEWYEIYEKILQGGPPFDWEGTYYRLRGVHTHPLPLQRPRPPVMSAGASGAGRQFAARTADILFTSILELEQAPNLVAGVRQEAAQYGRTTDVYMQTLMVCRPTRKEAEDWYYYFAEEQADEDALAYFRKQRMATLSKGSTAAELPYTRELKNRFTKATGKSYAGCFPGAYALVGTPDDLVEEMIKINRAGVVGSTLVFLNYLAELPYFVQEVLPRMERAGLRHRHENPMREPPRARSA
jgi:alkanesulfonate monooxygenase SsuD/methylene tetrahydromethanopterin reductase-like flavin-dependent oxidoreductase (luciferase family)